jgi:hypothetical protein
MRLFHLSPVVAITSIFFVAPAFATTGCNAYGWDGFEDVRGCMSSYPAITYLADQDIVQGYADGTFGPERSINRAEFTKILMGVKSTAEERATCLQSSSLFPDVAKSAWYAPYVCVSKERGIVSGYEDGKFRPEQQINYAEAAKIAANAYSLSIPPANSYDPRWYGPYAQALSEKNAVPPTVESYDNPLTRGEMSELIYRLETGKTSLKWFASIGDGDEVSPEDLGLSLAKDVSFWFPGSLFSAKSGGLHFSDIFTPDEWREYSALRLTHVYQGEGCSGMAGYEAPCRPAGTEIAFAIGLVDRPLEYIRLGLGDVAEEDSSPITIDGREGFTYWSGIECEGVEYTFVPADATRTLAIARDYNCNDVEREPGFLSTEKQQELLATFLNSIHIHAPAAAQNAPTLDVTLYMCKDEGSYQPGQNDPVVPVSYTIPKTTTVADSVLRLLFHSYGKREARTCDGISSLSYYYKGVTITNGIATVKLTKPLHEIFNDDFYTGDNSTSYLASAKLSIEKNLKQYPTIHTVVFSPE